MLFLAFHRYTTTETFHMDLFNKGKPKLSLFKFYKVVDFMCQWHAQRTPQRFRTFIQKGKSADTYTMTKSQTQRTLNTFGFPISESATLKFSLPIEISVDFLHTTVSR